MIWLVVVEGIGICVLGLLVVALAHSYAGLAARVDAASMPHAAPSVVVGPHSTGATAAVPVADLVGVTPDGESVLLALAGARVDTLLAFLSSSCTSCQRLWDELPGVLAAGHLDGVRVVVVVKGPEHESPSAVAALAASLATVDVIMSSSAWQDFEIPGSPYFALVRGASGEVSGQGTAMRWQQVAELIGVAGADARSSASRKSRRDRRQELDVDQVLLDAGVLPGDPSLYPMPPASPRT
jgi:hypothetical protein